MQLEQLTNDEKDAGQGLLYLKDSGLSPADTDRPQKMQRSDNSSTVRDFLKKSAIGMQESKRGPATASDISGKPLASAKPHTGRIPRKATIPSNAPKKTSSAPSQQKEAPQHVSLPLQTYFVPHYYMPFIPPPPYQSVNKGVGTGQGSRPSMQQEVRDPRAPQVSMKHAATQTENAVQASIKSAATQTSSTTQPVGNTLRDMILTKHWHTCKVCLRFTRTVH